MQRLTTADTFIEIKL